MTVSNLTGLEKPLTKLTESICEGIGVLGNHFFEFDAKKIKRISKAEAEAKKKEIIEIEESHKGESGLLNRANKRFLLEQYNKQVNLENTFAKTKDLLRGEEVSDIPVEKDWIARFMGIAQDVSREDLQNLLSKILAGEIKNPNTFSYRTLEVLKNLTKEELLLFRKFSLISDVMGDIFLCKENIGHGFYTISYGEILKMIELGLIQSSITIQSQLLLEKDKTIHFEFKNYHLLPRPKLTKLENFPVLKSTNVGKNISSLIEKKDSDDKYIEGYFKELIVFFENSKNLKLS